MYPAYSWTDSYPHHTNSMHYAPVNDRRHIEIPSQMKMDPSTLNIPYQPWPYVGNHYHTVPHEYNSCCNHGCFGGCPYSFRHPYPHYPPPPPPSSYGFYPPFPGTYPGYSGLPPHYSIEQPRYDYDKNTHAHSHCSGCKIQDNDKKLSIEQEEPEVDKKTSNSLVPLLLKNYPYPIMWVPPGYMDSESEVKEKEKHSPDPASLKPIEYLKKGGNNETAQDQQREDHNRLPFPIFWLPYKNNEAGKDSKENGHNPVAPKELPSFQGDDNKKPTRKTDEGLDSEDESEFSRKFAVQKVIPVKQLGRGEENKILTETKAKSSVDKSDNGEGKHSPRSSKLPPVCLRIDPLPKKKKSSRSPSPPDGKERSKGSPADDSKSSQQQIQLSEGLKKSTEQPKGNVKTIKVINDANKVGNDSIADLHENVLRNREIKDQGEGKKSEKGMMQDPAGDSNSSKQAHLSKGSKKSKEEQNKGNIKSIEVINNVNKVENDNFANLPENVQKNLEIIDQGEGNGSKKEMKQDQLGYSESCKAEKKNLSEDEAALIIQSVYRGFEVRKSQPLMKLRQIALVGKQVVELRNRIQDLESSTSTIRIDDKQKLIIGETIMSLLLKLDTIQGLHPVVRDVRKSVAKELVGLQDKLDSLTSVQPETQSEVVHPEDGTADDEKSDQAQVEKDSNVRHLDSASDLCENHEVEPTSVCVSTEQSADDAVQVKFEQTQAQSDSDNENAGLDAGVFKNYEAEDADLVHKAQVMKTEQLVEPSMEELNNNQLHLSDAVQEKSDQAQVESGTNVETMESDVCEHHGLEAAGSQYDNGAEICDMTGINLEPQVDLKSQQSSVEVTNNQLEMPETEQPVDHEKSDQAQPQCESDGERMVSIGYPEVEAKENHGNEHVEVLGSAEAENDVSMVEKTAVKAENDGEHTASSGYPEVKPKTSEDDGSMKISDEEDIKVVGSVEAEKDVSMVEMAEVKPELPLTTGIHVSSGGDRKINEDEENNSEPQFENMDSDKVERDEESGIEAPPILTDGDRKKLPEEEENDSKAQIEKMDYDKVEQEESRIEVGMVPTEAAPVGGDDQKKLTEENEKLRVAVQELMKAGNEQVKVIKELTGRVKDLEKKLSVSKKKKIKVRKCRSPASVIVA